MNFRFIAQIAFVVWGSVAHATAPVPCELPESETIRSGLVTIADFSCNNPEDCGVLFTAPSIYEGRKFSAFNVYQGSIKSPDFIFMVTSITNNGVQEATFYGKAAYLNKLTIGVAYEAVNFCGLTSSVPVQHNKTSNATP